MKILALGDVFAEKGRSLVKKYLPILRKKYELDFIIVNGENTSHGKSITQKHYQEYKELGVDIITSGNHIFKNPEVVNYINAVNDLLKPLNMSPDTPGNGTVQVHLLGKKIRVTNLMGRAFMDPVDNPYTCMDQILANDDSDIHIVDFHAESTAEKIAFAWNYDGVITMFYGTHTHVQTADERILPKGTGFITDLGMVGAINSCIGMEPEEVIIKEKTGLPARFAPANGDGIVCGVVFEVNDHTNKVSSIERIMIYDQ